MVEPDFIKNYQIIFLQPENPADVRQYVIRNLESLERFDSELKRLNEKELKDLKKRFC